MIRSLGWMAIPCLIFSFHLAGAAGEQTESVSPAEENQALSDLSARLKDPRPEPAATGASAQSVGVSDKLELKEGGQIFVPRSRRPRTPRSASVGLSASFPVEGELIRPELQLVTTSRQQARERVETPPDCGSPP